MSMRSRNTFRGRGPHRGGNHRGSHFGYQNRYRGRRIVQEGPKEEDVGITEYLSKTEGFSGVIKARFSDFHVNEINLNGELAKLTDTKMPNFHPKDAENEPDLDPSVTPLQQIPQPIWDDIKLMLESPDSKTVELDVTSLNKEERSEIHETIKKTYGQKIVASTKSLEGKKVIEFKKYQKSERQDFRTKWPKDLGEYVYFLVYKETIDTIQACFKISDCLHMRASSFSYAGVKDRRAKTTQWFCVKKVEPSKLINKTNFLHNIQIGNITFMDEPLKLGQLQGNRFRVAVRNVTAEDSQIETAMELLKKNGFINYYGLQRFGSDKEVPTYSIGKRLLQGNWKGACDLILKPKNSDDPNSDVTMAKNVYSDTGDASKAAKLISSRSNSIESKLLQGFGKNHPNDFVNALEQIPRNVRLLYIHSFQSLIWNQIVSRRIREFGLSPIVGDLVLISENVAENIEAELSEPADEGENIPGEETVSRQEVKFLTEEDLPNYSIYDVVLPLPGYDIQYPNNVIKDWYKESLESHKLSLEMTKQKVKTYNLSGAYRKVVGQLKDLSWQIMKYDNPEDVLIRSDYEQLRGKTDLQTSPDGKYKALVIDFCLNSSCYATMVLREVLKTDTSSGAHSKLNDYHVKTDAEKSTDDKSSLLTDADKYGEFKKLIFGDSSESCKRKAEDDPKENSKKLHGDQA